MRKSICYFVVLFFYLKESKTSLQQRENYVWAWCVVSFLKDVKTHRVTDQFNTTVGYKYEVFARKCDQSNRDQFDVT